MQCLHILTFIQTMRALADGAKQSSTIHDQGRPQIGLTKEVEGFPPLQRNGQREPEIFQEKYASYRFYTGYCQIH